MLRAFEDAVDLGLLPEGGTGDISGMLHQLDSHIESSALAVYLWRYHANSALRSLTNEKMAAAHPEYPRITATQRTELGRRNNQKCEVTKTYFDIEREKRTCLPPNGGESLKYMSEHVALLPNRGKGRVGVTPHAQVELLLQLMAQHAAKLGRLGGNHVHANAMFKPGFLTEAIVGAIGSWANIERVLTNMSLKNGIAGEVVAFKDYRRRGSNNQIPYAINEAGLERVSGGMSTEDHTAALLTVGAIKMWCAPLSRTHMHVEHAPCNVLV